MESHLVIFPPHIRSEGKQSMRYPSTWAHSWWEMLSLPSAYTIQASFHCSFRIERESQTAGIGYYVTSWQQRWGNETKSISTYKKKHTQTHTHTHTHRERERDWKTKRKKRSVCGKNKWASPPSSSSSSSSSYIYIYVYDDDDDDHGSRDALSDEIHITTLHSTTGTCTRLKRKNETVKQKQPHHKLHRDVLIGIHTHVLRNTVSSHFSLSRFLAISLLIFATVLLFFSCSF